MEKQIEKPKSHIIGFARLLLILGLSSVLAMVVMIWWTISTINNDREISDALKKEVTVLIREFDQYIDNGDKEIRGFLEGKCNIKKGRTWIDYMGFASNNFIKSINELDLSIEFINTDQYLNQLKELRRNCIDWCNHKKIIDENSPAAIMKLKASLHQLQVAVKGVEGQQKLQLAVLIRDFQQADSNQSDQFAHNVIKQIRSGANLMKIQDELYDLSILIEHLFNENQLDYLIDYKDNQFKPVLERLRSNVLKWDQTKDDSQPFFSTLLKNIETDLFGEGVKFDNAHQTIIPGQGGFYYYIKENLAINQMNIFLQKQILESFKNMRDAQQQLDIAYQNYMLQLTLQNEKAFNNTWHLMLFLSLIISAIFVFLALSIINSVKTQVAIIESTNEALDNHIHELGIVNNDLHIQNEKREKAEKALLKSEEYYRSLYETSRDGIVYVDLNGYILDANQAYLNMFGYSLNEIYNKRYMDFTPQKWVTYENEIIQKQVLERGYSEEFEKESFHENGTLVPLMVRAWLVKDDQGQPVRMLRLVRDITEQKRLEHQLRNSMLDAERHNVMIESFGAVCHHLSQPLTALFGNLSLLQIKVEKIGNADLGVYYQNCLDAVDRMSSLLQKLQKVQDYKTLSYTQLTDIIDIDDQVNYHDQSDDDNT